MYDHSYPRVLVATYTVEGESATIAFTGNGDSSNFDQSAINGNFNNIKNVTVTGPVPQNFNPFNNLGHQFSACQRVDFSGASGNIPSDFHSNVQAIVFPNDKSFSYTSNGSKYIIIAGSGESETTAVRVWAKNDSNNDWANDPVVQAADYIKAYTDANESNYVTGDVITNLRASKWVNGEGTVFETVDFTYPSTEYEGKSLAEALAEHLATKKIGNCKISGEVDDLSALYGMTVQSLDLSDVTNTDLSELVIPTVKDDTQSILLPFGVTYNAGVVTSTQGQGTEDQLRSELYALKEAGKAVTSVTFPDGSTYSNGELTAHTYGFLGAAVGGGLDVSKVTFSNGAYWEDDALVFPDASSEDDMKDIVGALANAGFVIGSVRLSSGTTWTGGTVTLSGSDGLAAMKTKFDDAGLTTNGVIFTNGTRFENGKLTTVSADEGGPDGTLKSRANEIRTVFGSGAITALQMTDHTEWNNGTVTAAQGVNHNELLINAGFNVTAQKTYDFCGTYVTEKDGVVTLTIPTGMTFNDIRNNLPSEDQTKLANATSVKIVGTVGGPFTDVGLKDKLGSNVKSLDLSEAVIPMTMTLNGSLNGEKPLTTLKLPTGGYFTKIPDNFCTDLSNLSSVDIPSQVTVIGKSAFQGCSSLSNINWGNDCHVEVIEESAFQRANISGDFVVPNSVRFIMPSAFANNDNMKTLTFTEYSKIESIGAGAFAQSESTAGKLSDVFVNVVPAREIECAHGAFDKFHTASQTQVGTVTTRLHYPREYYEYYVGAYKSELYDPNLDVKDEHGNVIEHTYGVITQAIIDNSFNRAANGWQEFLSSGIPVGENSLYRTYSENVSHLVPNESVLQIYLVDDYNKEENLAYCVQMKEGDLIPANTGFIIHSTRVATIYLPYSKSVANPYNHEDYPQNTYKKGGEGKGYNNYLKPINGALHIDNVEIVNGRKTYRNYFFNNGTTAASRPGPDWKQEYALEGWGFFRAATYDYTVWNKAFLHLPAAMTDATSTVVDDSGVLPQDQGGSAAKSFGLYFISDDIIEDGFATSIEHEVARKQNDNAYYSLQGVRVTTPTNKGIYIQNGKKVIVK